MSLGPWHLLLVLSELSLEGRTSSVAPLFSASRQDAADAGVSIHLSAHELSGPLTFQCKKQQTKQVQ